MQRVEWCSLKRSNITLEPTVLRLSVSFTGYLQRLDCVVKLSQYLVGAVTCGNARIAVAPIARSHYDQRLDKKVIALRAYEVMRSLLGTQGSSRWVFVRRATVAMDLSQSLIPFVSQTLKGGVKADTTTFEEAQVMGSAFAMSTTDVLPRYLIDDHLRFESVK